MKLLVTTTAAEQQMAHRAAASYAPSELLKIGQTLGGPVEDLLARVAQQLVERRDAPVKSASTGKAWTSPNDIGIAVTQKAESAARAKAEAPSVFARETVATLKESLVKNAQSGGQPIQGGLFETSSPNFGFIGDVGPEPTTLKEMQPGFREALDAEMTRVFGGAITVKAVEFEGQYGHDSDGMPNHYSYNRFRLAFGGDSPFLQDLKAASQASRDTSVAQLTSRAVEQIRTALENRVAHPQPVGTPLPCYVSLTASPTGARGGFTPQMTADLKQGIKDRVKADSQGLYEVVSAELDGRDHQSRYDELIVVLAAAS